MTGSQCLEGDGWERKGWPFSYGLKYLITKKVYKQSFFFSLISNNLNWEILTNDLTTFKGSDGVKDEKFKYYKGLLKNPIFKGSFHEKPLCIAENCLKWGTGEGLAKKEGLVFLGGIDTPMHTMRQNGKLGK